MLVRPVACQNADNVILHGYNLPPPFECFLHYGRLHLQRVQGFPIYAGRFPCSDVGHLRDNCDDPSHPERVPCD